MYTKQVSKFSVETIKFLLKNKSNSKTLISSNIHLLRKKIAFQNNAEIRSDTSWQKNNSIHYPFNPSFSLINFSSWLMSYFSYSSLPNWIDPTSLISHLNCDSIEDYHKICLYLKRRVKTGDMPRKSARSMSSAANAGGKSELVRSWVAARQLEGQQRLLVWQAKVPPHSGAPIHITKGATRRGSKIQSRLGNCPLLLLSLPKSLLKGP